MENQNSLLGVIETLYKWRKQIIVTTLIAAIGSSIIVLLIPVYYKSTTIFYAASPDLASPEPLFGKTNESMEYYGDDEDIDRIMTIANSSEMATFLINAYNLYEHYGIDTTNYKAKYYVREKLSKLYEVKKTKFDAIELSVEDTDQGIAMEMANAAQDKIDRIAQRLIKASQFKQLETMEAHILEKENALNRIGDSLEIVRAKFGVYNTETQSELLATLLAKSEANLASERARLQSYKNSGSARRDTLANIQARIDAYKEQAASLQAKMNKFNEGMAIVDVLAEVHKEASEQLGKDKQRYEQIKSAHGSYFPAIHLVEPAEVPIIKSRPKRTLLVAATTLAAFLLSVIGVLLLDAYRQTDWKQVFADNKNGAPSPTKTPATSKK